MGYHHKRGVHTVEERAEALDRIVTAALHMESPLSRVGARYMTISTIGVTVNLFSEHSPGREGCLHSQHTVGWSDILKNKDHAAMYAVTEAHKKLLEALG